MALIRQQSDLIYNAFNVYCRELAPGTASLTGDRAQSDDSKHCAYSKPALFSMHFSLDLELEILNNLWYK